MLSKCPTGAGVGVGWITVRVGLAVGLPMEVGLSVGFIVAVGVLCVLLLTSTPTRAFANAVFFES